MRRSTRLFEIIQILRAAGAPVTAEELAAQLEVSVRTVYRDIAELQAQRTPIEGEAGIGYLMRRGYDLPPLNFDAEEVEALWVGLSLLARTGDSHLQRAANRICQKIEALHCPADWLHVAPWGAPVDDPAKGCIPVASFREAIRAEQKIRITYENGDGDRTERVVRPVALIYHTECTMLAGWCELRDGFRHFRTDRIWASEYVGQSFSGQARSLRELWQERNSAQVLAGRCDPSELAGIR
ncbi:helix-turn-helix transcriptional regulator [Ruegeria profundi]|uniref:Transcriptional regulator n=1 Tax=Ruegeria profundi TaxID=1685378 RepID=A0A0X3U093_9RHOB|nr:YafY family protein [Ruegeria profundi]KUJ79050.1 transcriptional regulator [Ruegeria profundi]